MGFTTASVSDTRQVTLRVSKEFFLVQKFFENLGYFQVIVQSFGEKSHARFPMLRTVNKPEPQCGCGARCPHLKQSVSRRCSWLQQQLVERLGGLLSAAARHPAKFDMRCRLETSQATNCYSW